MNSIPKVGPVKAISFARYGYDFIRKEAAKVDSDIFELNLWFDKFIVLKGEEQAKLFYDKEKFKREGAAPERLVKTLFGKGAVQGLDGENHQKRKEAFMSVMGEESRAQLLKILEKYWGKYIAKWEQMDKVVLFPELEYLLCEGVCEWAGVPLPEEEVVQRTKHFEGMIKGTGGVALRYFKGRKGRTEGDEWIADIIEKVRAGELNAREGSVLKLFSEFKGPDGNLLDAQTAAVEVINVLRPTVAVARFIIFAALALHDHPEYREKLLNADDQEVERFVQEVRRFYPFFPFLAAKVRENFEWNGITFPKDTRVILDLYGTNHDPALWDNPDQFRPERFLNWDQGAFNFIPQGGGNHYKNHRCPGEWLTIDIMKQAVRFLVDGFDYVVPKQDLSMSLIRIPAIPESRFIIKNIRMREKVT